MWVETALEETDICLRLLKSGRRSIDRGRDGGFEDGETM
jgi:hypothetical protein